mmetsp:Transcript_14477/g.31586  ORF Transcript_14477/g.31586 Transcript_14477/m.31586 type:complete len:315 (-) Transcript_14477:52-996(-)
MMKSYRSKSLWKNETAPDIGDESLGLGSWMSDTKSKRSGFPRDDGSGDNRKKQPNNESSAVLKYIRDLEDRLQSVEHQLQQSKRQENGETADDEAGPKPSERRPLLDSDDNGNNGNADLHENPLETKSTVMDGDEEGSIRVFGNEVVDDDDDDDDDDEFELWSNATFEESWGIWNPSPNPKDLDDTLLTNNNQWPVAGLGCVELHDAIASVPVPMMEQKEVWVNFDFKSDGVLPGETLTLASSSEAPSPSADWTTRLTLTFGQDDWQEQGSDMPQEDYEAVFSMSATDPSAFLRFRSSSANGVIYLDNVQVYRR